MNSESKLVGHEPTRYEQSRLHFFGFFRAWLMRIVCATWRKQSTGLAELDRRLADGEKLIAVLWHQKYVTLLPLLRNRHATVFTSLSSRGNAIADLLTRFGFTPVQIPDGGREKSLNIMRSHLADGHSAVIAVDGPLGPYHLVHRGAVQLASELGHAIMPISVAVSRKRVLSTRWDKLEIPRLFSRVHVVVGDPIYVPGNLIGQDMDLWIQQVHEALESVDTLAQTGLNS